MKKYFILLLALFVLGCQGKPEDKIVLAKINNYEITLDEFGEEFNESSYAADATAESKEDFLNNLINRKLILQDAQKKGLDKDKSFLKMIERFWEQSLLKLAIDKKTKEIAGSVMVHDKEIDEAYNNMPQEVRAAKPYESMYQQIKWQLTRDKESQLLNDWIAQLHKKSEIKVNYDLLKQGK